MNSRIIMLSLYQKIHKGVAIYVATRLSMNNFLLDKTANKI